MTMKKLGAILMSVAMVVTCFSGCGTAKKEQATVYYLNFKPEAADTWEKIAEEYEAETGVKVKILTSASGNYEQTLKSEIAKRDMPTSALKGKLNNILFSVTFIPFKHICG